MTSPPGPKFERRSQQRIHFATSCACRLVAPPDLRCRPGLITDVSPSGIGLVVTEPLPVGVVLAVRPSGLTRPDEIVGMKVQHVTPLGDGNWLVGCSPARNLAVAEVRTLLDALTAPR